MKMKSKNVGLIIESISLTEYEGVDYNAVQIKFTSGEVTTFVDNGQQCCEHRYFTADDILSEYAGAKFLGIDLKEVIAVVNEDSEEEHEIAFLEIMTSKGSLTFAAHNDHNGCYSGIDLEIVEE